jgi:hypothetical protein
MGFKTQKPATNSLRISSARITVALLRLDETSAVANGKEDFHGRFGSHPTRGTEACRHGSDWTVVSAHIIDGFGPGNSASGRCDATR